ncbi:MAG: helix-turn-helix domain-containing protein [Nitrospirota bacterium]
MTRRLSGIIKRRRTELGLSQRALAKRVGVSDAYITQPLHVLKKLANARLLPRASGIQHSMS